ncbi:putative bifunctional diguanylate cyclase/phosphodiesterase [Actinomadura rupiterrae]|uniref:putative bifunctional diguanylate cyclase/phosphodiesterase n=1 Tax=Actinomadura rupiterrae TaxID=559627 RepID=UPI0020A33B92|nr:sensor domain-containing phosphodiesterase [Actinomadura rupiterrae]MCP2339844.1 diguanylate cyclase (GGDEF)-like protein [Actinomadura rupiterrae]
MSGEGARRLPPWAVPVGMVAVIGVLYTLGSMLGWGGPAYLGWAETAAAAAAAACLLPLALRRDRTPGEPAATGAEAEIEDTGGEASARIFGRPSWRWFGIAAAAWGVGALSRTLSAMLHGGGTLALSVTDPFYLVAMFALVTGLVVPIRLPRRPRLWARYAADTYVCVAGLFVLGWVALFGTLYHRSGESPSEFLLELLYPLVGTVLVCGSLPFVVGADRGDRRPAWLAYGALTAFAGADIVTTVVRLRGGAPADDPADILRLAGLLLLVLIPWLPGDGGPAVEPRRGRMIGPGLATAAVAALAALFVAGHSLTEQSGSDPVVPVVAGTATLVLLARLAELLRENDSLRRAVETGEDHFRALSESINDAVLICDLDAVVQYASAGALRIYRYEASDLLGRPLGDIIHPEDLPRVREVFAAFLAGDDEPGLAALRDPASDLLPDAPDSSDGLDGDGLDGGVAPVLTGRDPGQSLRVACRVRAADGTWLPTESTVSRYAGAGGAPSRLLVTTRDLSEQAALQRQVAHLTFHDGLTGLPNRAYFEERTREVLSRLEHAARGRGEEAAEPGTVAVVFVDLDGFTDINDSAGHAAGDQVLAQAARRLRGTVHADDTVARWGGDEFAVMLQLPGSDSQAAVELAERLLRVLSTDPYLVGSKHIALTASVGIAFTGDSDPPEEVEPGSGAALRRSAADLIRNGDLAMARAKELGGGRVEVFAPHMHADAVRRLELGSDLQRALAEEEFAVEFQPVVELGTSRVTGVEALVRWWRGSEPVPPEEFIGPAEESGLMIPLGDWVLHEACREVARWRADSWDVGLSVNFTARQIAAPRFVESVAAALEQTGLPPHALTLEVREEVLVEDGGQNVQRLSRLRDLGVRLAIDDFGTGYASLAYLGQLPVDIIKIDPSFVAGLGRDETLTLLTRTIVRLGRDLGLTVVAEGIERPEQLELLREMDCPRGQGFLVARPMAAGRVESLVRTNLRGTPGQIGLPLEGSALTNAPTT